MKKETQAFVEAFFARHDDLVPLQRSILTAAEMIYTSLQNGNKLLLCGNGGSCADCDHIAGELLKGFLKKDLLGMP